MFKSLFKTSFLLSLTLITLSNVTSAQHMVKQVYQILVYGSPPDPLYQNAEKVVGIKWNITQVAVAGCVVSASIQDSVTNHNHDTYALLAKEYGDDWQFRYYKEIEEEYKNEVEIAQWIDENMNIQNKLNKNEDAYFMYEMFPVHGTSFYDVKVNNIETWEDHTSSVTYLRLRVNRDSKEIKITSEKKELNFAYE